MFFKKKTTWNTQYRGFNKYFRDDKGYNTIISNKLQMSLNTFKTRRNNNMVVLGGAGSGKYRFVVLPNLLQANCNYVINDVNGEIYQQTAEFFKEQGYNINVINFKDPYNSTTYNPFCYFNDGGIDLMVKCLTEEIPDAFIKNTARILLLAVCYLLIECCSVSPEDITLLDALELIRGIDIKDKTKCEVSKIMQEAKPDRKAATYWKLFDNMSDIIKMETIVNIILQLQVLDKYNRIFFEFDGLCLEHFSKNKSVLFIIGNKIEDKPFINLLNAQIFKELSQIAGDGRLHIHTRFIFNDWMCLPSCYDDLSLKIITARRKEISFMMLVHDIIQFKNIYGEDWEVIWDCFDTLLFLGCQGQSTLEYIREMLKHAQVKEKPDLSEAKNMISDSDYSKCIVFVRGLKPFYDNKYDITKHPNYKYLKK